jgi:hypothetical protein
MRLAASLCAALTVLTLGLAACSSSTKPPPATPTTKPAPPATRRDGMNPGATMAPTGTMP